MLRPRILETAHMLALAVWLAGVAGAGLTAAVVFPILKKLGPTLPGYGAYDGEHWQIAGGYVGQRAFGIAEHVQIFASAVSLLTLVAIERSTPGARVRSVIRWIAVLGASMLAVYQGLVLSPRMNDNLESFRVEARAGHGQAAASLQAAFDSDHPIATRVMSATVICLLAAIGAGAWGGRFGDSRKTTP